MVHIQNLTKNPITLRLPLIPGVSRAINLPPNATVLIDKDLAFQGLDTLTEYLNAGVIWFDPNEINPGGGGGGGATGPAGPDGAQGPQGATGLRGITGLRGLTGLSGAVGDQGATGLRGPTGFGIQGITGLQGVTGPSGSGGTTGVQGIQGVTGPSGGGGGGAGATGVQGIQGVTGLIGPAGSNGTDGSTGPRGETGIAGVGGATGVQGVTGPSGGGGGGGEVMQWLSFDSGKVRILAQGSSTDLASITASRTFLNAGKSTLTLNRPGSGSAQVKYISVTVVFSAAETAGRSTVEVVVPEPYSAASLTDSIRPVLLRCSATGIAGFLTSHAISGSDIVSSASGFSMAQEQVAVYKE